jgi:4-hydroxy-tetrahydrodipicolinate synthase
VLYYKYLMVLEGSPEYELHFYETDKLADSQKNYATSQLKLFKSWYANWDGRQK